MSEPDEDEMPPLTPEEEKRVEEVERLHNRFPTFVLLLRTLRNYSRLHRLRELMAPRPILDSCEQSCEDAMRALCAAFPFDSEVNHYHLEDVLHTLREELMRPHQSSKTDA